MSGILDLLNSSIGKTIISGVSQEANQPKSKTQDGSPIDFALATTLSTIVRWFTCIRLLDPHLMLLSTFSITLTTMALYHSRLRWFEASSCKATSRGLPSSSAQLRIDTAYAVVCARGTQSPA